MGYSRRVSFRLSGACKEGREREREQARTLSLEPRKIVQIGLLLPGQQVLEREVRPGVYVARVRVPPESALRRARRGAQREEREGVRVAVREGRVCRAGQDGLVLFGVQGRDEASGDVDVCNDDDAISARTRDAVPPLARTRKRGDAPSSGMASFRTRSSSSSSRRASSLSVMCW